ncbi:MAG TPA: HIT family protein [Alphaproteobacteria bacterium]|nr:HIT family protein [Alphaproteobacteria bacterium]
MKDCFFCKVWEENIGIIFENKHFYSRFDRFPLTPGHAEVIPKRHADSILDLKSGEWPYLYGALEQTIRTINSTDLRKMYTEFSKIKTPDELDKNSKWYSELSKNPAGDKSAEYCKRMLNHIGIDQKFEDYNIGINNGPLAGRTVHHLHIHIIPRYKDDVEDPTGGIRNMFPGLGNYKK